MSDLLQTSGSGLTSVVSIPSRMESWPKLGDNESLSRFHAKFWGKSIADEEREWRKTQPLNPAIGGELGDKDQDGDDCMGRVVDDGLDERDERDLDDEIIPGCYTLDLGIEGFRYSRIWIRADYIRVYDHLNFHYNKPAYTGRAPAAVLTGQPGIGDYASLHHIISYVRPFA
jgi:hypothetical protein